MNKEIEPLFGEIDCWLSDPRKPRGVRHPCTSIIKLLVIGVMCGLVSEICTLAGRWWGELKIPLGFTGNRPPHPTTITR